jgi:hypothetical protein
LLSARIPLLSILIFIQELIARPTDLRWNPLKSEILKETKSSKEKYEKSLRENHNQTELSDILLQSVGERVDFHFHVLLGSAQKTPNAELVHLSYRNLEKTSKNRLAITTEQKTKTFSRTPKTSWTRQRPS